MPKDDEESTDIVRSLVGVVDGEVRMEYKDGGVVASDTTTKEFLPPLQFSMLIVAGVASGGLLLCNNPSTPRDTIDTR